MGSQESLPLSFDASAVLLVGESISNAESQLIQIDNGQDYVAGRPTGVTVAGALLTQTVTALQPRKRYRLVIQFSVALNKTWAPYLMIDCPE
jgi:hypothetical protein